MRKTIKERFYEKVGLDWRWRNATGKDGYGRMIFRGKMTDAHGISYMIHNGAIPEGVHVLHSCDDPGCVNPEHLHLGTHADNMREMMERGRRGGKGGGGVGRAKLTPAQVLEIREKYKIGAIQRSLAKEYEVNFRTINYIVNRVNWKHI